MRCLKRKFSVRTRKMGGWCIKFFEECEFVEKKMSLVKTAVSEINRTPFAV